MKKDRKRNNFYIIFGITAGLLIAAMTASLFAFPMKSYSKKEKRYLAAFPTFSLESVLSGRFMDGLEDFAKDQFYERDLIASIKSEIKRLSGDRENNGVYLLSSGRLAEDFTAPEEAAFNELSEELRQFSEKNSGSRQYFMLVPTAISFYQDELPDYAVPGDQDGYIDRVFEALPEGMDAVDVRAYFRSESETTDLYYKTDHHWTTAAAKIAAAALLLKMGYTVSLPAESGVVSGSFVGSLAVKSGFQIAEADAVEIYKVESHPEKEFYYTVNYVDEQVLAGSVYSAEALSGDDPYEVFFGGNHAEIEIKTSLETGRKLLLIKDSYANAAIPFLIEAFDEITIVDPRYYRGDIDLLTGEKEFTDIAFLYNANTLSGDTALPMVLRNEQ